MEESGRAAGPRAARAVRSGHIRYDQRGHDPFGPGGSEGIGASFALVAGKRHGRRVGSREREVGGWSCIWRRLQWADGKQRSLLSRDLALERQPDVPGLPPLLTVVLHHRACHG